MPMVKMAISLPKSLLERVDALAQELDIPRSHVLVLAMEEFLQRYENHKLLKEINETCKEIVDREEELYWDRMRQRHRENVAGQW